MVLNVDDDDIRIWRLANAFVRCGQYGTLHTIALRIYSVIISAYYDNFRPFSRSCTLIVACFNGFLGDGGEDKEVLENITVAHKGVIK